MEKRTVVMLLSVLWLLVNSADARKPLLLRLVPFRSKLIIPLFAESVISFDGGALVGPVPTTQNSNITMSTWVYYTGSSSGQVLMYNGHTALNGYGLYVTADDVVNRKINVVASLTCEK